MILNSRRKISITHSMVQHFHCREVELGDPNSQLSKGGAADCTVLAMTIL